MQYEALISHKDWTRNWVQVIRGQEAQAVAQLPDFSVMAGEQAKATGTDEKKVNQENGDYKPAYKKRLL